MPSRLGAKAQTTDGYFARTHFIVGKMGPYQQQQLPKTQITYIMIGIINLENFLTLKKMKFYDFFDFK